MISHLCWHLGLRDSSQQNVRHHRLLLGFTRLDVAMYLRLTKVLRVQVNVENIANIDYIVSTGNKTI